MWLFYATQLIYVASSSSHELQNRCCTGRSLFFVKIFLFNYTAP